MNENDGTYFSIVIDSASIEWPWRNTGEEIELGSGIDVGSILTALDGLAHIRDFSKRRIFQIRYKPLAPPWALWAQRLGQAAGLGDDVQARIAIAVALLTVRQGVLCGKNLWLARQTFYPDTKVTTADEWLLGLCARESVLEQENPPVGAAVEARNALDQPMSLIAGVATWGLPALVAGWNVHTWEKFGQRLFPLIKLVSDLSRLWRDETEGDIRNNRLSGVLCTAVGDVSSLVSAWAGGFEVEERAERVREFLARDAVSDALTQFWASRKAIAQHAVPPEASGDGREFIHELDRCFHWIMSYGRFRQLAAKGLASRGPRPSELAKSSLRLGIQYLVDTKDWQESWEIRRCGLVGKGDLLVGSWFHRGFVLRILQSLGHHCESQIEQLLAEQGKSELRWFGDFRHIPPDADSLGLALELVATEGVCSAKDQVECWLAPMLQSLVDGKTIPTWFYSAPSGPTLDDPEIRYQWNDCTAVRLAAMMGLLCFDAFRFAELIEHNLGLILERAHGDELWGVRFYPTLYGDALFARFLTHFLVVFPQYIHLEKMLSLYAAIGRRIKRSQRLDGSWGSPQETSWCLSFLLSSGCDRGDVDRAVRFLGETQRPDGSWAAEPFYIMPGKAAAPSWHMGRALTTAVCCAALDAALKR